MKKTFLSAFGKLRKDRPAMTVCIVLVLVGIAYIVYMGVSLTPVDNQIAVRYTAYGGTNLYRNHWYYLLSFIGLAIAILIIHIGLIVKLLEREIRSLALVLGWLTVIIFVIFFVLSRAILSNAYFL